MCLSEPRSLWSGTGAASEVQGRRQSPRRWWPPHARAPRLCLSSKTPAHAGGLLAFGCRPLNSRGFLACLCALNLPTLQAPAAAAGDHPGRSAPFKAHRAALFGAALPCARASCAAFGWARGLPARSRADGSPPPLLSATHTSTRPGPPATAMAFGWVRGLQARSRAGPPVTASRHTHEHRASWRCTTGAACRLTQVCGGAGRAGGA